MERSKRGKALLICCIVTCLLGIFVKFVRSELFQQRKQREILRENRAVLEKQDTEPIGDRRLCGSITIAGSTAMEKFSNAVAEGFMLRYPDMTVTVEFTGSSAGIASVLADRVDIGNSSRSLQENEKACGAVENIVAIDGIAVITDASNPVVSLTVEQLIGIYTGKIWNWREAGGLDEPIVVVGREAGSGTRCAFEKLLGIEDKCMYANELDSTGAVMAKAATIPGTIGYVSLDVLDDTVKVLAIDGVEPTKENIKLGRYFLRRPFVMVTDGEISEQSREVRAFFTYLRSPEGQKLIQSVGLVVLDEEMDGS